MLLPPPLLWHQRFDFNTIIQKLKHQTSSTQRSVTSPYFNVTHTHTHTPDAHCHPPAFVESALALVTEVLGEDGLEGPQATDCVDVPNNPHHHHRRSLDDSDSLHRLTFGLLCWEGEERWVSSHKNDKDKWPVCSLQEERQSVISPS